MWQILIYLAVGLVLGYKGWIPYRWCKAAQSITSMGLLALLFAIGVQLGGNPDVIGSLGLLGWQALVIALFSILGSVVALVGVEKVLRVNPKLGEDES